MSHSPDHVVSIQLDQSPRSSLLVIKYNTETKKHLKIIPFREYVKFLFTLEEFRFEFSTLYDLNLDLFPLLMEDETIRTKYQQSDCIEYMQLTNDAEIMKLIVSYNIHGLSIASKRLQDDRELVQIAVDHFPYALQYASERLRDDRELVLRACSNMHFTCFDSISDRLKNDEMIVKLAIQSSGLNYSKIPEHFRERKDITLIALNSKGRHYFDVPEALKNDFDVRIATFKRYRLKFNEIYPEIKDRKEIVLELSRAKCLNDQNQEFYKTLDMEIIEECVRSGISFKHLPFELISTRKDLILLVVANNPKDYLEITSDAMKFDRDILLMAISKDSTHLQHVQPNQVSFYHELVEVAMKDNNLQLKTLSPDYSHYKEIVLQLLPFKPNGCIRNMNIKFFNDRDVLLTSLKVSNEINHNYILHSVVKSSLLEDEEIIRAHLSARPSNINSRIEMILSSNKKLLLKMTEEFDIALYFLDERMLNDKEVVMRMIHYITFIRLPKHMKEDKDVLLAYIQHRPQDGIKYINSQHTTDFQFIKNVLKFSKEAFHFLTPELKLDRNFIFEIVEKNPKLFECLDSSFRNDRELIMMIVKMHGTESLDEIPESLRNDKELLWEAVKKDDDLFRKYPMMKIEDRDFLLHAVKHCISTLRHATPDLCDDYEVVMQAVKKSGMALRLASPRLQNNPEIVKQAILSYEHAFDEASPSLKQNFMFCICAMLYHRSTQNYIRDSCFNGSIFLRILKRVEKFDSTTTVQLKRILLLCESTIRTF